MLYMAGTREVLNNLISQSMTPFTVTGLKEEMNLSEATDPKGVALKFLYKTFKNLLSALNIELLTEISKEIKKNSLEKMRIEDLKLSTDPTIDEVKDFLTVVHQEAQKLQTQKDELAHYTSFFNSAKAYVVSFASAADIIMQEVIPDKKELKLTRAALMNDTEVYKVFFTNMLKDLNRIADDILSPRTNLCLRLESSVRLLEKFRSPDIRFNISTT